MRRRRFLACGLMLVGYGRRVWAQFSAAVPRYFALSRPIRIPLDDVTIPWKPAMFTAEAMAPGTPTAAMRRVLISGVLFRKTAGSGPDALSALCLTCPHEQCKVDLITDPVRLAQITAGTAAHPLFECGCHFSLFDAAQEGTLISGEAPRGLYRFRIGEVSGGMVEVTEIEEVALSEV